MNDNGNLIHYSSPDQNELRGLYEQYREIRLQIVNDLKGRVEQALVPLNSIPTIKGRIKNFTSYYKKYLSILKNGNSSPNITDVMGIKVICPFIEDLEEAERLLMNSFEVVEAEQKSHYSFKEFGYESIHLLIRIPEEIIKMRGDPGSGIAEIQIRTILMDAWAEVEHELFYKAAFTPFDDPMKRKLAAVNASLTLADIVFQEIRGYQRQLNGELDKRRESFFQKIEESTDALLFMADNEKKPAVVSGKEAASVSADSISIDDLLLHALSLHNKGRFNEAVAMYSRILELNPNNTVGSIIYKHRGMAHFACSQYSEAIDDFSCSLEMDGKSYKAAYYRGVVNSVQKQYSQAIDDFTLSLSINPYQSFCLFRRGQAYYHIGDYPKALSDCEASLALEPKNETVQKFRELLHNKLRM